MEDILEKVGSNKGMLTITGVGLGRTVFLFDQELEGEFDWGYTGDKCKKLAYEILKTLENEDFAKKHFEEFTQVVVAILPPADFKVEVDMGKLSNIMSGDVGYDKAVSSYHLMYVYYGDLLIPKFLDVLNIRYKTFIFSEGTLEYRLLSEMSDSDQQYYRRYVTKHSERYDHQAPNNSTRMTFRRTVTDNFTSAIVIENGLGSEETSGHSLDTFMWFDTGVKV